MESAQTKSFSTPLKQVKPEDRQFGSVPYINRNIPLQRQDSFHDDAKHNNSKRDKENDNIETESPWKKPRAVRTDGSREDLDSSPELIALMDHNAEPPSALDVREEQVPGMISTAVRNISNSDLLDHENGNQTSMLRNLLSPARHLSPEKRPLTPIDHDGCDDNGHPDTGLSNLGSLTPLKGFVEKTEDGLIQALQSQFRQELNKYEHHLQAKNKRSDEYREEIIKSLEKVKELDEQLDEKSLAFSVLWSEHQVLKTAQATREAEWKSQSEDFERLSGDNSRLEERVSKLKSKLSELRNEIKMLHQNSQILQEKFQLQVQDNDGLRKQLEIRSEFENKLQNRVEDLQRERDEFRAGKDHQEIEVTTLKNEVAEYEYKTQALRREIADFESELQDKEAVCKNLQNTMNIKQLSTTELENRVGRLVEERDWFEKALDSRHDDDKALEQGNLLIDDLTEKLEAAKDEARAFHEREKELEQRQQELEKKLAQGKTQLDEVTDQVAIRSAELEELQHDNAELLQTKVHLEEFVKIRDAAVEEWKSKFDNKSAENNRLAVELESVQFRNGNLESEHLVELEQLHQQMTSLQDSLRVSSEQIKRLETEREALQSQIDNDTGHVVADDARESPATVELRNQIQSLQQQLREKDSDTNKRLLLLAEDLYIQYSSKHEQKVKMLKKGYESKYQDKIGRLNLENTGLHDELTRLNTTLKAERDDKERLVQMLKK
ncbi:Slk19p LALA0_S10e02520g [Lachancea lanzarotensis]|uniref:LALA0S10e02520g1_1 n=1 Tax=Lachancea lanzarotensis TaxID=1245769 RepID=A0A0C7NEJ8_9SACH|nr:uncharacterized protein LALA0_S10e02520g [Lachancea lanzarotensis]CEP64111.1 LALA0S10e02520g1_1 [Lachancea lanzarotensis]